MSQETVLPGEKIADCQYGTNPWQQGAAHYSLPTDDPLAIHKFQLVEGNVLSYNNLQDFNAALNYIAQAAAIFDLNQKHLPAWENGDVPHLGFGIKHKNACGGAAGNNTAEVIQKTLMGDPLAIFSGILIFNFPITKQEAETLLFYQTGTNTSTQKPNRRVIDFIAAPEFSDEAIALLKRKKGKCRLLANPTLAQLSRQTLDPALLFESIRGGYTTQPNYDLIFDIDDPDMKKYGEFNQLQLINLLLAIAACRASISNTITLVNDCKIIGNGTGGKARVQVGQLAIKLANDAGQNIKGAIAVSDSFFPDSDGALALVDAGIAGIFTVFGSIKDKVVKKALLDNNVILWWVHVSKGRTFKH